MRVHFAGHDRKNENMRRRTGLPPVRRRGFCAVFDKQKILQPQRLQDFLELLVDILVQVAAANSALNSFSKELLAQHISTCVADDLRAGSEAKLDELVNLLPKLMK